MPVASRLRAMPAFWRLRRLLLPVALLLSLHAPAFAQELPAPKPPPAKPPVESAEDAFKRSLSESIDQRVDPKNFGAFIAIVLGIILFAIVFNQWRARAAKPGGPKSVHSLSKLLKEVGKQTSLRPAEVKQLRILCEQQEVQSPLVLLLCPSVLSKAVRENQKRIDRTVLSGLARKISNRGQHV